MATYLNYPVYSLRDGHRMTFGPPTGAYGETYGQPIITSAEFQHLLKWLKSKGFNVYANTNYGGVNMTAHSPKSWHYVKDQYGNSLAADVGTYGDVNERSRLINEVIPHLDRMGVAWHYARDGKVPNHYDHLHIDVSNWGRKGGPDPYNGYYETYKKISPFDYLKTGALGTITTSSSMSLSSGVTRAPRRIAAYYGSQGSLVKAIQRIVNVDVDGEFGLATKNAVMALQRKHGIVPDGSFGPATAKAYLSYVGDRGPGSTGYSVMLIQWIAGITMDGSYGNQTVTAVKEMQRWAGITADGYFGPNSRSRLIR